MTSNPQSAQPAPTGEHSAEPIVGIDLGTTNSLVAIAGFGSAPGKNAAPRILPDADGRRLMPSAVRFEDQATGPLTGAVVGHDAREHAIEFPETTIQSVKRLMGRSLEDAQADRAYLSFAVVEGANNTARIALPSGRVVSPQEVSALILDALRKQAEAALGVPVHKAVVTVPAYFDDAQRQATRDAGRLAGLEVVRIVNEPTAAALAYGIGLRDQSRTDPETIIVYDLGGGTFDVSVLRLIPGSVADNTDAVEADCFQVLSTSGDTHLGGDDFDTSLIDLFTTEIHDQHFGPDTPALTFPPQTRRALRSFAEATKIRLSEHDTARVQIDIGDGRVYDRTITRVEFEKLIAPLVDRTLVACRRALRDARREMAGEPVSAVVLVGGSTRVPLVRTRVAALFDLEPYTALDPDEVVALGAAVQASILAGDRTDALLLDVVPLSLGIETVGGAFAKIIDRNASIPSRRSERFSTSIDGQQSIKVHVLQGEREMAADCRSLGVFHLSGIPAMPAGIPKLLVTFAVDANGILNVSAVEERSGKRASIQIVPNHGLSAQEVERMELESFQHARDDMLQHRIVDLIANARLDLHWINRQLGRVGSLLEASDRTQLAQKIDALNTMVQQAETDWKSVDADAFASAKQSLDEASIRLHEIAIAESLKNEQVDS